MTYNLDIPDDFKQVLLHLTSILPDELKKDAETQKIVSVYLKFGGVKLAQLGIGIIKMRYYESLRNILKSQKQVESDETDNKTSGSFFSKRAI